VKRYRLMIPGPVEVEPEVLNTMSKPIVVHYGPDWTKFFNETINLMKQVMLAPKARLFLMAGPGTASLDAAIGNTIGDGKKILVAQNGYFGDRLAKIARSYTKPENVKVIKFPVGEAIDANHFEDALRTDPEIAAAAFTHCETSTGVLNPVQDLFDICQRNNTLSIADSVTSMGSTEFRFDAWGCDIAITASQKSFGLFPGIAPVAISERAWEVIERTESPGWYLNFKTWQSYVDNWGEWHPHPVTMPSNLVTTLHDSCKGILQEGLESRWARHRKISGLFRKGLENLGYRPMAPKDYSSPTITPVWIDDRISATDLIAHLKEHHNILIAGGLDELSGKIFRVGHMGPTANTRSILPLLYGIEDALRSVGEDLEDLQSLVGLEA